LELHCTGSSIGTKKGENLNTFGGTESAAGRATKPSVARCEGRSGTERERRMKRSAGAELLCVGTICYGLAVGFETCVHSLASRLSTLRADPAAEIFHELMSDALVWSDERVLGLTAEEMGCLRGILRYRTSLIVGIPDTRFEHLWKLLKAECPDWIGFSPARCNPSEELHARYKRSTERQGLK
jgi:hypothetical protein